MKNTSSLKAISVIGIRAYPSEFVGTSGIEVYVENVLREIHQLKPDFKFQLYTKKIYQIRNKIPAFVKVIPVWTIRHKVLESVIYSLLATIHASFSSTTIIWYHTIGMAMWSWIPKLLGKKILLTVHSKDWKRKKWNFTEQVIFKTLVRLTFGIKPTLTAVSPDLVRFVKDKHGLECQYAPPGIVIGKITKSTETLQKWNLIPNGYLLYLGRIVPEKRLEWLLEAFIEQSVRFPHLKLVISGGHGNLPEYETLLKNKYIDARIIWTGYVFGDEKKELLSNCKVFVLPSELEGAPIALAEALGFARLCLISRESAPDFSSYLRNIITFNNRDLFEEKLIEVSKIEEKFSYNMNEIKLLKKFSWNKTAAGFCELFKTHINKYANRSQYQ